MSRPRSAAPAAATASLVRRLLRDGARFVRPTPEVLETAGWLERLGVVQLRRASAVRCANPLDQDFPPPDRGCDGVVELASGADEGGGDYRCPSCDRLVFPEADGKQVIDVLSIGVSQPGIERLLIDRLGQVATGASFLDGVLAGSVGGRPGGIVLADYCTDGCWLSSATARLQPCIYVTVSPDAAPRMTADPAITHIELAEILLKGLDLPAVLAARVENPPRLAANLEMPVYAFGARPRSPAVPPPRAPRLFKVGMSPQGICVDDLLVVPASQHTACSIMQTLVVRMAGALGMGRDVAPASIEDLADEIGENSPEAIDAESVRRALNRMRTQITTTVRRVKGTPIDDNDIVEAVSRTASLRKRQGYRLNPRSVVFGAVSP